MGGFAGRPFGLMHTEPLQVQGMMQEPLQIDTGNPLGFRHGFVEVSGCVSWLEREQESK